MQGQCTFSVKYMRPDKMDLPMQNSLSIGIKEVQSWEMMMRNFVSAYVMF